MRISLDKPRSDINCVADVKSLAIEAMGSRGDRIEEWPVDKVCSRRLKVGDGLISELGLSVPGASGIKIPEYFLLAEGELYLCRGIPGCDRTCSEPCDAFPLTWDQKEPGLDVYFDPPKFKGRGINLYIRTLTGKTMKIRANPNETIYALKLKIQSQEDIPLDQQRLTFAGSQLEDHQWFCDYGIGKDSTLHLELGLRGDMYHRSSGRDGFGTLELEGVSAAVTVRYGPGEDDRLEVELGDHETRGSLMERANERIAAIRELQDQIAALRRVAAPPSKKRKTSHGDYEGNLDKINY